MGTALWYDTRLPPVAIRWVLIRDPQAKVAPQALLCTDQAATATRITPVVCIALAVGSDPARGAYSPGSGDTESVVRSGYLAHHPCLTRTLFSDDFIRSSVTPGSEPARSSGGLV